MSERYLRIWLAIACVLILLLIIFSAGYIDSLEAAMADLTQQINGLRDENELLDRQLSETEALVQAQADLIQELKQTPEHEEQEDKTNRGGEREAYALTDAERDLIERVVMAESGGESYEGQMLVAQCILNACEIDGIRPADVITKYVYAKGRPKPTDSVRRAVSAVFDKGETVTDEAIVYFYNPHMVKSDFHERQRFVVEEGNHKFFCEREG